MRIMVNLTNGTRLVGFAACIGLICFQSTGASLAHTVTADQMRQMSGSDAVPTKRIMLAQGDPGSSGYGPNDPVYRAIRGCAARTSSAGQRRAPDCAQRSAQNAARQNEQRNEPLASRWASATSATEARPSRAARSPVESSSILLQCMSLVMALNDGSRFVGRRSLSGRSGQIQSSALAVSVENDP